MAPHPYKIPPERRLDGLGAGLSPESRVEEAWRNRGEPGLRSAMAGQLAVLEALYALQLAADKLLLSPRWFTPGLGTDGKRHQLELMQRDIGVQVEFVKVDGARMRTHVEKMLGSTARQGRPPRVIYHAGRWPVDYDR